MAENSGGSGGGGVLVRGAEPSAGSAVVCDASSRAARRRRMQIRRLRLVDAVASAAEEAGRKRQQVDCLDTATSHKVPRTDRSGGSEMDDEKEERMSSGGGEVESGTVLLSQANSETKEELPLLQGIESGGADHCLGYGMTSIRGRRRDMEDTVSIFPDFLRRGRPDGDRYHFFGIYDGHGCSHVAASCKDRMHEIVAEEMGSGPRPESESELKEVLERSFLRMDGEVETPRKSVGAAAPSCRCELQTPMCNHVGSTAVVAVVGPDRIVVSNCGDSRAVLCRSGAAVPLSTDHKPDRPDELQRIQAAGGRVIYWDGARVLGVLAMSRAIGDGYLKPYVTSEPDVTVTERTEEDECLILASDGLWDVVTNEMACYIARMCLRGSGEAAGDEVQRSDRACSDAAMLLTKLALARHSADNVSVVVVDLRRRF